MESINLTHACKNGANKHKGLQVRMVTRAWKRLQERLKRKKKHVMVMLLFMNTEKKSSTQRMNVRSHQRLYAPVIQKRLGQSKNMNMKICEIVLQIINNLEGLAADSEKRTADFEGAEKITANINIDIPSLLPQGKQNVNTNKEK